MNHAWPADVRGSETDFIGAGLVTDLPIEPFRTDPDHVWIRFPLDLVLSDRLEAALVEAGLMPLSALPYSEEAVFSAVRSLQAPASYIGRTAAAANANARLSAQLNSMPAPPNSAQVRPGWPRAPISSRVTRERETIPPKERDPLHWPRGCSNSLTPGPRAGPAFRWSPDAFQCTSCRAAPESSVARCICSRISNSTTSRRRSVL